MNYHRGTNQFRDADAAGARQQHNNNTHARPASHGRSSPKQQRRSSYRSEYRRHAHDHHREIHYDRRETDQFNEQERHSKRSSRESRNHQSSYEEAYFRPDQRYPPQSRDPSNKLRTPSETSASPSPNRLKGGVGIFLTMANNRHSPRTPRFEHDATKNNLPNQPTTSINSCTPTKISTVPTDILSQKVHHQDKRQRCASALSRASSQKGNRSILKTCPKYGSINDPNPTVDQAVSVITAANKVREKQLVSNSAESSHDIEEKKLPKIDFVPEVENSKLGYKRENSPFSIMLQEEKAIHKLQRNEHQGGKEHHPPIARAYQDALLDAFGLRSLKTTEVEEERDGDVAIDEAKWKKSALYKSKDEKNLKPNFSRALHLILSHDRSLLNMELKHDFISSTMHMGEECLGMTLLFAAVKNSCHRMVHLLLRLGAKVRQKDRSKRRAADYIDKDKALADFDLGLKLKLILIYEESYKAIDDSCSVHDWQRIQLKIMGVKGLQLTNWGEELQFGRSIYGLVKIGGHQKNHKTAIVDMSKNVDFKSSKPYSFLLNGKSQLRKGALVEVQIHMGRGKYDDDHVMLSSWTQHANELVNAATSTGIGGSFDLGPSHRFLITEGAKLELHLQLLPKDTRYEKHKKQRCAVDLCRIVDELVALQGVLPYAMDDDDMINISIPYCCNLSLLHAAVYVGDKELVSRLLKLGIDTSVESENGTPLEIACRLLQSEICNKENPMQIIYQQLKDAIP